MPDVHAGAGCVVGMTMTVSDSIIPNLVGVDIGCGMETINIGPRRADYRKLDKLIRESIPAGFAIRERPHRFAADVDFSALSCAKNINWEKAGKSVGTLGGGNHFIELDLDEESGDYYLIIHSGSRGLGFQVAEHHKKIAGDSRPDGVPYELAFLTGDRMTDYIRDLKITREFAVANRRAIADEILKGMKWKALDAFSCVHNYLDEERMIIRKGAISAAKGERALIPLNMRDGALICAGLGNPEWNYSAPHGAGRLYSRADAKSKITLTQFKNAMRGIYSTSVNRAVIDESPDAYKPMESILNKIGATAIVRRRLRPVYNFKAGGE